MTTPQKLSIVACFYLGWFGCVYFAKWDLSVWSFAFPIVLFFVLNKFSPITAKQFGLLLGIACVGILFDFFAATFNWISIPNGDSFFLPYWLLSMWLLFVGIFPVSLSLFSDRLWLAGILGAIFGPLSYYSGEAFHVLSFTKPTAIFIYAFFWGIYFPVSIFFYRKLL